MAAYNTSSAYDLQSFERAPKVKQEPKLRVLKSKRKGTTVSAISARSVGTFMLVVMVMVLIIYNQTCLNEVTGEINAINKEIAELQSENTRLGSIIENKMSLFNIGEMAQEMGMKKLDKYQIEYVSLYKENRIETAAQEQPDDLAKQVKMTFVTIIGNVKEYMGI